MNSVSNSRFVIDDCSVIENTAISDTGFTGDYSLREYLAPSTDLGSCGDRRVWVNYGWCSDPMLIE